MKDFFKRGSSQSSSASSRDRNQKRRPNPILDEYLRNNPEAPVNNELPAPQLPQAGDLATSSIFEDGSSKVPTGRTTDPASPKEGGEEREYSRMEHVLDPNPGARERWERKKVMQMVRRGGRMSAAQMVKRTEREHLARSHNVKTSVKKLGMLARQIAGKTLDDAIVQMRFSKKKAAIEVREHLEAARDEAIVARGMGLGLSPGAAGGGAAEEGVGDSGIVDGIAPKNSGEKSVDIQLKDGRRHTVTDRSKIYVDQAWVGRGPYGHLLEYRARGRVNVLRTPWTSISVVLKEEATRVREWQEREAKRKRQRTGDKVWTAMPDRPIQIQRQWYSW